MKTTFATILIALVLCVSAAAQSSKDLVVVYITAGELSTSCQHWDNSDQKFSHEEALKITIANGFCQGYIVGFADNLTIDHWNPSAGIGGVTQHQLVAVVKQYIDSHPQLWGEPAFTSVTKALSEAFPPKPLTK